MKIRAEIRHGDCLELLRAMPDASVDLVFCSPPYEAARTYGIDFKLRGQDWVDWAVERFIECYRVSRGLTAWVIEGQTHKYAWSAAPALFMADLHRRGVKLRKPPAFCRVGIPGSGGPDFLRNDWEWIVCATHGKLPWSDNTAMGHPPKWGPGGEMSNRHTDGRRINAQLSQWGKNGKPRGMGNKKADGTVDDRPRPSHAFGNQQSSVGRRANGDRPLPLKYAGLGHPGSLMRVTRGTGETGEQLPNREVPFPVKANPGNLIKCKVGGGLIGHDLAHENEAPFPLTLAEFFVRSFCPPGGTVLDPFMGSGTTLHAALKWGRNAIGIDVRQSQVELTRRRLEDVKPMQAEIHP